MYRFQKPTRPVARVFIHCSASDNPDHDNVATMEAWHLANGWSGVGYHLFCRKSGQGELGRSLEKIPAAQGGHNRGSIAICLHGLSEDKFTDAQKAWLVDVCAQINQAYNGAVTFHGHCEVAAKTCPVFDYREVLGLDEHGYMGLVPADTPLGTAPMVDRGDLSELEAPEAGTGVGGVLRLGDNGKAVEYLQEDLKGFGYHSGAIDGHFGPLTRAALLAFQADNFLVEDGIAGPSTQEAILSARRRQVSAERATKSVAGLARDGSRIAQASMAQGALGSTVAVGGVVAAVEESTGAVTRIARSVGVYEDVLSALGPWVGGAVVLVGVLVVLQAIKAGRARRDDHREAKTL